MEHVRADGRFGAGLQGALNPVWRRIGGGCNLNRETGTAITSGSFEVTGLRRLKLGSLPVIVGSARPQSGDGGSKA